MLNVYDVLMKLNSDVTKLHVAPCLQFTWYHGNKLICVFSENMKDYSKFFKCNSL